MMSAIEQLRSEHETILLVLTDVEKKARTDELSEAYVTDVLDFVARYVERNHHGKEEQALFARMRTDPVLESFSHVLHEEHEQGAGLVAAIERAIDEDREAAIIRRHLLAYTAFLRDHITRENEMIFPAIENTLDEQTLMQLVDEFRAIELEALGTGDPAGAFLNQRARSPVA